jgi:arginine metabolism regulation protein II
MNHLIEAERLIRQRGPNSTHNTFQYRALIHVYAYYRIIMESICFATGRCTRGTSNGSLERFSVTEDTLEVGLDPAVQKTSEVGYNDIHLDFHGKWQETLYTKIYGVPETLLTMLSQTVKLANGKQRLESVAVGSKHVSDALRRHTKRLERNIWTLRLRDDIPNGDQSPTSPLVLAVHQAIIVYFYRQVRRVDAMILQGSVRKALDHLEPCIAELEHGHDLTFLVAWAAFVVACEAATDGLQKRSLDCLTQIEACAGFFVVRRMSDVAKRVWEHRERTDDWTVSWLDVASSH